MSNPNDWEKYGKTSQTNLMKLLVDEFWPGALNIVVENISPFHYAIMIVPQFPWDVFKMKFLENL